MFALFMVHGVECKTTVLLYVNKWTDYLEPGIEYPGCYIYGYAKECTDLWDIAISTFLIHIRYHEYSEFNTEICLWSSGNI